MTVLPVYLAHEKGADPEETVRHNDLGDLTLVEWLVYLDDHAKRESLRIRVSGR